MPADMIVADFGCGDARLSASVPQTMVHSFDLVAANERVTACNMENVPLNDASIDVAVFCLSLMGTDFWQYIQEAWRVLKPNGLSYIAEVQSRFVDIEKFIQQLRWFGFKLRKKDESNKMFVAFDLSKIDRPEARKSLGKISKEAALKPCIYKRR